VVHGLAFVSGELSLLQLALHLNGAHVLLDKFLSTNSAEQRIVFIGPVEVKLFAARFGQLINFPVHVLMIVCDVHFAR